MKAQEATMKSLFNTFVENSNKRIDNLTEKVKGVIVSLEYSKAELQDLKKETQQQAEAATKLRKEEESKSITHEKKVKEVNDKLKDFENKTEDLENRCRRNNLCFDGVREEANESSQQRRTRLKKLYQRSLTSRRMSLPSKELIELGSSTLLTNPDRLWQNLITTKSRKVS